MSLGKTAVALSGGAALGLAHVGVLKALEEFNIRPAFLAGTSAGSIIGAFYARGLSISEIEDIVLSIDRMKTIHLLSPSIPLGGLMDPKNFVSFMEEIVGKNTLIEDLQIPFVAVTVDFRNGNILYLNKGRLVDAVRASISIPGVFRPLKANGSLLVDGGLRENLPLRALEKFDYDTLLGVNVLKTRQLKLDGLFTGISVDKPQKPNDNEPDNFLERITNAIQINKLKKLDHLPRLTYVGYQSILILLSELSNKEILASNPDLVLQIDMSGFQFWEFWRGKEAIETGYREACEQLTDFFKD
ncbi:MAG: patatin-like phospholipase family protein [Candidatus Marinimicrobia bacterium]|nr:patatin-like phospholipase family protein [Candidatus Neomarinimicrobiota bacterium]